MKAKLIHSADGLRTFAVVLQTGDEVISQLKAFADQEKLSASQLTGIGAFGDVLLGFFDWENKQYRRNRYDEQVEVASFIGDIAVAKDGERSLHVHVVLGRRDNRALAGHLFQAHVRPTLEIILTESPAHLRKRRDPESGLALIDLSE